MYFLSFNPHRLSNVNTEIPHFTDKKVKFRVIKQLAKGCPTGKGRTRAFFRLQCPGHHASIAVYFNGERNNSIL